MYEEPNQVYAIVFGHLVKTFGKVQTSKFNKVVDELGYDKVSAEGLRSLAKRIEGTEELSELTDKAVKGEVSLEDINYYHTDVKPFEEESLFSVVTPYQVQHQRVLKANREFSKIQREGAYTKMLFEDLKKELKKDLADTYSTTFDGTTPKITENGKTLVVLLSDFHIGATIQDDFHHGGYDYSILVSRLHKLLEEAYTMAEHYSVEDVVCLFLGDAIESADMRGGQKWGLEFTLAEQVSKATKTLLDFLEQLEGIAPVTFAAIRGNHDRLTGQANKKDTIYNDSAMYIILDTLMTLQEVGALQNTEIFDNLNDMYDFELEVRGKTIHGNHGDMLKGNGSHLGKFIKTKPIDILVTGHVHNFNIRQDRDDAMHIVVGSPMGYNTYSKELLLDETAPSQTLMLMENDKSPIIQTVYFGKEDTK